MAGKRTAADERLHNVERIHQLLSRLGWIWPLIVMLSLLLFATAVFLGYVKNQTLADAEWRVQAAAEVVHERTGRLISGIESVLLASQEWSRDGLLSVDDPEAFNRQLVPLVAGLPVTTVQLANDEGRAMLLMRTTDGWANRATDVPKKGQQQHWWYWNKARERVSEAWKTEDWDPRNRPWYTGVMVVPELQVVWMAPHVLQVTGEAVISASVRWYDHRGHQWVLSFSVDLTHFPRLAESNSSDSNVQVALLTGDGKLLGLSGHALFGSPEIARQSLLQDPAKLGFRVLDSVLHRVGQQRTGDPAGRMRVAVPAVDSGDGQSWLGYTMIQMAGRQSFRIVSLAPEPDAFVFSMRQGGLLVGVIVLIGGFSVLAGHFLASPVRRVLTRLFARLEEKREQAENLVERRNAVAAITARMQRAQRPDDLAYSLLCELAPRLQLGRALFCLWDESAGQLHAVATYAGEKTCEAEEHSACTTDVNIGLAGQCARDRRVIVLHKPGGDYMHVRSGLGDASPAEIVLLPVQYGERLFAVMELAGMREFTEDDRMLLADLEPIIALNLDTLLRAERTAELLAQTAANEERHRLILGAVADGIWGMDVDGRTGFVNRTALDMLGFSEQDVIGQDMHVLVHACHPDGSDYPRSECPISLTAMDGVPRTVDDEVFWSKEGHPVHVEYTTTAVHRQDQIVGVVVVFRDIGGRKAVEQSIRESEALLWQIVEDSPSAAAIVTEDGRVLRCNKRLLEVLNVGPDYFSTHLMVESWERPEERKFFVGQLMQNGVMRNYPTRFRKGNGEVIKVVLNSRWVVQGNQRLLLSWLTEAGSCDEARLPSSNPPASSGEKA